MSWDGLIDALDATEDLPTLIKGMSRAAEAMGLPVFSYFATSVREAPVLVATYAPQWRTRFLAERYDRVDPIEAKAQRATLPFSWCASEYIGRTTVRQRGMFGEAAEFGLSRGFTVPIRQEDGRASTLTFATDERAAVFARNIEDSRHLIHLLAIHFDAHIMRRLDRSQPDLGSPTKLSPRETECLRWTARGKSTFDVAAILGIGRRTVVFHLVNVRRKFDVATTRQAIAEAVHQRLIGNED